MGPVQHLIKQVLSSGKLGDFKRTFIRKACTLEDTGRESKVSSIKHELGAG